MHDRSRIRRWLVKVIDEENKGPLSVSYIFCSDKYLQELNEKFLNHSSLTDILTFPDFSPEGKRTGDIFISIDRIRENAEKYGQPFERELHRVMVHGVLHLLGYDDRSKTDKANMTIKEDHYLYKI